ncbi:hypothetical protein GCM10023080_073820 [Streptomyces pseudoechinosporeus]
MSASAEAGAVTEWAAPAAPSAAAPASRDTVAVRRDIDVFILGFLLGVAHGGTDTRTPRAQLRAALRGVCPGRGPVGSGYLEVASTASSMRATTCLGWASITRWEESTSIVFMPARS